MSFGQSKIVLDFMQYTVRTIDKCDEYHGTNGIIYYDG